MTLKQSLDFIKKHRALILRLFLMVASPFSAVFLMQYVYCGDPWLISGSAFIANALCVGAVYYLLCALIRKPAACSLIVHTCCALFGALNYFVSVFRGTPVLPWDLTALNTALAVSSTYDFTPTLPMFLAVLLLVGMLIAVIFGRRRDTLPFAVTPRFQLPVRLACLALALFCAGLTSPRNLSRFNVRTDVWDQRGAYQKSGILATFLRNTEFMNVDVPADTSVEKLDQILSEVTVETPVLSLPQNPHVIAIMNESWADFEEFGNLELTQSVISRFSDLDNALFSHAYASVFGAGTSASEFEFLTGNSMSFLPSGSIPYQQYILKDSFSLAAHLKQLGYQTAAFHPGERSSWQRDQAYPRLGFDTFKSAEELDVPITMEHGYISDETDFDQIIWEYEHRDPEKPLFLFNVTIQNHGAYTVKDYPAAVDLLDEPEKYPMAQQYLTLINKTEEQFLRLTDYFSQQEEPVLILMFGDHQPSVEPEFLEKAYGVGTETMSMEEYMNKYRVPFVLWANYPFPELDKTETSLNFLSQLLLNCAGLPADSYGQYLQSLQQDLPVLTFAGYMDTQGKAYSHWESTDFTAMIQDYQTLQYERLFGTYFNDQAETDPEAAAQP